MKKKLGLAFALICILTISILPQAVSALSIEKLPEPVDMPERMPENFEFRIYRGDLVYHSGKRALYWDLSQEDFSENTVEMELNDRQMKEVWEILRDINLYYYEDEYPVLEPTDTTEQGGIFITFDDVYVKIHLDDAANPSTESLRILVDGFDEIFEIIEDHHAYERLEPNPNEE